MANSELHTFSINRTYEDFLLARKRKKIYVAYFAAILLISVLFGFLSTSNLVSDPGSLTVKTFQIPAFAFLGVLHVWLTAKNLLQHDSFKDRLFFSLQLSFLIGFVLFVFYTVTEIESILTAVATASAFLLPFIVFQAWDTYKYLSTTHAVTPVDSTQKIWYPVIINSGKTTSVFYTGTFFQIKLPVKSLDRAKHTFFTRAPLEMNLGDFFDHFLLQKNNRKKEEIELLDDHQQPYGWKFFAEDLKGLRRRSLDPQGTLESNEIQHHTTIVAERVQTKKLMPG